MGQRFCRFFRFLRKVDVIIKINVLILCFFFGVQNIQAQDLLVLKDGKKVYQTIYQISDAEVFVKKIEPDGITFATDTILLTNIDYIKLDSKLTPPGRIDLLYEYIYFPQIKEEASGYFVDNNPNSFRFTELKNIFLSETYAAQKFRQFENAKKNAVRYAVTTGVLTIAAGAYFIAANNSDTAVENFIFKIFGISALVAVPISVGITLFYMSNMKHQRRKTLEIYQTGFIPQTEKILGSVKWQNGKIGFYLNF